MSYVSDCSMDEGLKCWSVGLSKGDEWVFWGSTFGRE